MGKIVGLDGRPVTAEWRMAVDLVCGVVPDQKNCTALTGQGLMRFVGNQHNERWEWVREKLEQIPDQGLLELYAILRKGE